MSELKYKLLALDMDGTLLNDNHEITQETAKWIQIAIRRGCMCACPQEEPYSMQCRTRYSLVWKRQWLR